MTEQAEKDLVNAVASIKDELGEVKDAVENLAEIMSEALHAFLAEGRSQVWDMDE